MTDTRRHLTTEEDKRRATVHRLAERGFSFPYIMVREARLRRLGLDLAAAMLDLETGGGSNVYGRDDVRNPIKSRGSLLYVTRANFAAYKTFRRMGLGNQGAGPGQLTSTGLQDLADAAGGCWRPECNMLVAFKFLRDLSIEEGGDRVAIGERYNGSHAYGLKLRDKARAYSSMFATDLVLAGEQ